MATTQPIRSKHQIRQLTEYYLRKGQLRNYVLIILGLHTALRISDLLRLKWENIYDFNRNCVRETIEITEKKTKKAKTVALNKAVIGALKLYPISLHLYRWGTI